ncbi:MAG: hypothetical protein HYU75_13990, partial [Betaproteobacteria bacterium]|nr:hypothetical protein [Betaproteobacteria bacterium]
TTTTTTTQAPTTTTTTASTTTTTQAGSSTLHLPQGWKLIGNGNDAPIDVQATFGESSNVTTVWKWIAAGDSAGWAFYAPSLANQGGTVLQEYAASKGYQVLTSISGGEGFWVNAKQAFDISLPAGTAIAPAYFQSRLVQGWNLVSVGETRSVREFNSALGYDLKTLWAWENSSGAWYFYAPSLDASGALAGYIATKGYLDFIAAGKSLGNGVGFWVNRP